MTSQLNTIAAALAALNIATIGGVAPVAAVCDDPSKVTLLNINLSAATGNQQLVAISASTVIYICALDLIADGAEVTVQLIRGTGTACATGETDLATYKFNSTLGFGLVKSGSVGGYGKTVAGDALCLETSASVALFGSLSYVQQ